MSEIVTLSEHFSLKDLIRSDTALRLGIDNTPPQEHIANLILTCEHVLEPVYQHFNIGRGFRHLRINSGYRSLALNMAINPMTSTLTKVSKHCFGQAVDFEIDGFSNVELAEWCRDNLPEYKQVILEFYTPGQPNSGWVHVSYVVGEQKKEVLTAARVNKKTIYKNGIIA